MFLFVFVFYHVTVWMGSNKLNWTDVQRTTGRCQHAAGFTVCTLRMRVCCMPWSINCATVLYVSLCLIAVLRIVNSRTWRPSVWAPTHCVCCLLATMETFTYWTCWPSSSRTRSFNRSPWYNSKSSQTNNLHRVREVFYKSQASFASISRDLHRALLFITSCRILCHVT